MPKKTAAETIRTVARGTAEIKREPIISIACGHCATILAKLSLERFTAYGTAHEATCSSCGAINTVGPFATVADLRLRP